MDRIAQSLPNGNASDPAPALMPQSHPLMPSRRAKNPATKNQPAQSLLVSVEQLFAQAAEYGH
ncbi:hypothetical protein CSQ88_11295 [Iodobacter sp. BJB302]|nr:hypothetical protein CSQ88_11295 [Iodobacter sp. BJB302]